MSVGEEKIKRDVLSLYSLLYPKNSEERELLSRVFSKEIVRLLQYPPSDVKAALSPKGNKSRAPQNFSNLKGTIHEKEGVRSYFIEYLEPLLDPAMPEEQFEASLSHVSLCDLKYLYSVLVDVPLKRKVTKKELLYKLHDFFNAEGRTNDIIKTLR